jgi:hypothetical protein
MEQILIDADVEKCSMTWEALGYEAGLEHVSVFTIQHMMSYLDYFKCVACQQGWINNQLCTEHIAYTKIMKEQYPKPANWKHVRFSDETHFGLGSMRKLMIIRKQDKQYCQNCIQEQCQSNRHQESSEAQKAHTWAAIGHNFKSDLIFYDVPGNSNGKMMADFYVNVS